MQQDCILHKVKLLVLVTVAAAAAAEVAVVVVEVGLYPTADREHHRAVVLVNTSFVGVHLVLLPCF